MQDFQRLLGGSGGGAGGGGERRLKSHNQQALKCPRCESLNTKFCYYNNYNLSQPRFFCKGCRRYWTNGGVLRTVPVGGGCRKTKRSKQKTGNDNPSSVVSVASTTELKSSDSQNSSSESSPTFTEATFTLSEGTPTLFSPNQSFGPPLSDIGDQNAFSEMGTFGSFITTCSDQIPLGFVDDIEHSRPSSHDGVTAAVAAEDWGLFDQSNWVNNYDDQSNHFPQL